MGSNCFRSLLGFAAPATVAFGTSSSFCKGRTPPLAPSRVALLSSVRASLRRCPESGTSSPNRATAALAAAAAALILSAHSSPDAPGASAPSLVPPACAARGGGASFFSASGDVIKDPESLLRWSLPIRNSAVRELQSELEGAVTDLRGLKWAKVDGHVRAASRVINIQSEKILAGVPANKTDEARDHLTAIGDRIPAIEAAVTEKSVEKVTNVSRDALRYVANIEEMMVTQFPYQVPAEFKELPQLKGRATVELLVKKTDDEPFDIDGTIYSEGTMTIVLDGYSAPISAGAFLDLVTRGFYDGTDVIRSDGFIIQAGKPKGGEGYQMDNGEVRTIPLEVFAKGDSMPTYGVTLEEDGRGTAATVLPFSSYGTLAMARTEFEPNSASSQFFWFLFEPDLTPAGRNLMDGNWAVFGYTIKGEKFLKGLQKGDRIVSAKVVDGLQNLSR